LLVLCAGTALIYWRVHGFDYVGFDDNGYILFNEVVRQGLSWDGVRWAFTDFHMSNWHPLTSLSYLLDVSLFGIDPGPPHVVNAVLHAINSVLVYALALALLRHWLASLLVAWLFMAHPQHVESVAWIAERKDLLCGLFYLLAILAYLRFAARRTLGRYFWVLGAFVLALLSKPMAVTLPIVLLLLDYWPLGRLDAALAARGGLPLRAALRLVLEKVPLFALSLASGLVTMAAQTTAMATVASVPISARALNATVAYATYIRDMFLPTRLAAFYPLQPIEFFQQFLPALALLGVISILAVIFWRRFPWLITGWLWYLLTLLPVIGLIQVGTQSHADRYMYLPSIGLYLVLAGFFIGMPRGRQRTAMFAILPAMAFYAALAWVQVGYWAGPYMLFSRVIDVSGDQYAAHVNLSVHFREKGLWREAEEHAVKAVKLSPGAAIAYANVASINMARNDLVEAEKNLRIALVLAPNNAQVLNNLGVCLERQGRLDEARAAYLAALAADPRLYKVRGNLERVGAADDL
jgi:tetratricopeptide (TPR) repeat protein